MKKMTLYYSKSSGKVKGFCGGENDMGYFGEDEDDFSKIYNFLVADSDDYVMDNYEQFKIVDNEIKIVQQNIPEKYL